MKKLFEIFFEEIPAAELNVKRKGEWKMVLPKSTDFIGLAVLKTVFLLFSMFFLIYFLSIVIAVVL